MAKKKKRIIRIRYPTNLDELLSMIKTITPVIRVIRVIAVSFVALIVVGYRETIMSMEFDPSLTGMLIWVLIMWVVVGGLK